MDLVRDLKVWFRLINRLSAFHKTFVDDQAAASPQNWRKSIILIAGLSATLSSTYRHQELSIFLDLFLKTIAPYFRIISVWITQGRLEDWRNEFVFAGNPKFTGKRFKRRLNEDQTVKVC